MNIWLLQDGEIMPMVPGAKKMRTWLLAEKLVARGHQVTWWASTFYHVGKHKFFERDTDVCLGERLTVRLLEAGGYSKNTSLRRILHHAKLGRRFRERVADCSPKPDVIVASHPIIEFPHEAVRYAKRHGIPVIVDIRDTWPDSFRDYFPKLISPLIDMAISPLRRKAHRAFCRCDRLVSMCQDSLEWGLKLSGRADRENTGIFYLGCDKAVTTPDHLPERIAAIREKTRGKILFTFVGTFGLTYDLVTVCQAAAILAQKGGGVEHFVLAGEGVQKKNIEKRFGHLPNLTVMDWLTREEVSALMSVTDVGLVPIINKTLPNKMFDCFASGKPVAAAVKGEARDIIEDHGVGMIYSPGDVNQFLDCIYKFRDDKLRSEMGERSRKLFTEHFDAEIIYSNYANFVENVANNR